MLSWFKRNRPVPPAIGEKWLIASNDGSPWPRKSSVPVVVLGVKDGWVRYSWGGDSVLNDQRLKTSIFTQVFTREEEAK